MKNVCLLILGASAIQLRTENTHSSWSSLLKSPTILDPSLVLHDLKRKCFVNSLEIGQYERFEKGDEKESSGNMKNCAKAVPRKDYVPVLQYDLSALKYNCFGILKEIYSKWFNDECSNFWFGRQTFSLCADTPNWHDGSEERTCEFYRKKKWCKDGQPGIKWNEDVVGEWSTSSARKNCTACGKCKPSWNSTWSKCNTTCGKGTQKKKIQMPVW
jgi:hypothetical protein